MGLFSKLRNTKPANDGLAKDVLTPAVLTMYADGSANDGEIQQLINLLNFSPIFAQTPPDRLRPMIDQIVNEVGQVDANTYLQATASRLAAPMRRTALLFAMRIALADGHLDDGEKNVMFGFAQAFGISPEEFNTLFEVIMLLQHRPVELAHA